MIFLVAQVGTGLTKENEALLEDWFIWQLLAAEQAVPGASAPSPEQEAPFDLFTPTVIVPEPSPALEILPEGGGCIYGCD